MKALINAHIFRSNYDRILQLAPGCGLVVMIKANAYGHGFLAVARFFEELGVDKFGVATIEEAEALRGAGIKAQILLMSGAGLSWTAERIVNANITPMISSIAEFEALCRLEKTAAVHIDVDTGMSRGGCLWTQVADLIAAWNRVEHKLTLEGLSTHFSDAETPLQIQRFESSLQEFQEAGLTPKVIHTAKSSAILSGHVTRYPGIETWVRPGIALYDSVMSLTAPVTLLKTIRVGTGVGYDKTWTAKRDTRLAVVRGGYADGILRALSNQGYAWVNGSKAPMIGRVSMDLITLDVTDVDCKVGDDITFMSIPEIAEMCGTIDYEVMTGISERVQRLWV